MTLSTFLSMPLVVRELRSQARAKTGFILRSVVVCLLLSPIVMVGLANGYQSAKGSEFFGALATFLFYGLLLLGPLISAGCITTEKEGSTLGLLFLSPLRPFDIVAAKFVSNLLRLLSVVVSGIPVLAVTLLLGGVTWQQISGAAISMMALVVLIVGVSVLVSAICSRTGTAVFLAYLYLFSINLGLWWLILWLKDEGISLPEELLLLSPSDAMAEQFTWTRQNYVAWAGQTFGVACIQAVLCLLAAARVLPKTLVVGGSETVGRWQRFRHRSRLFQSQSHAIRGWGPLFWLEWRRLSIWHLLALLLVLAVGDCWSAWAWGEPDNEFFPLVALSVAFPFHVILDAFVLGVICREVARERHDRTLELILCAPVRARQIVWSKFAGVWLRYGLVYMAATAPAFFSTMWFMASTNPEQRMMVTLESVEDLSFFCMLFVLSYRMSLASKSVSAAVLKTAGLIVAGFLLWGYAAFLIANRMDDNKALYIFLSLKIGMEIGATAALTWRLGQAVRRHAVTVASVQ